MKGVKGLWMAFTKSRLKSCERGGDERLRLFEPSVPVCVQQQEGEGGECGLCNGVLLCWLYVAYFFFLSRSIDFIMPSRSISMHL